MQKPHVQKTLPNNIKWNFNVNYKVKLIGETEK